MGLCAHAKTLRLWSADKFSPSCGKDYTRSKLASELASKREQHACYTYVLFPVHTCMLYSNQCIRSTLYATAPPLGYERENPCKASGFSRAASADPAAHEHSNLRMLLLLRNSLRTSELDEVTPRLVFPSKKPSARLLASFSRASPTHQQAGAHRAPSLSFRPRRHGLRHPG